jgi:hypothetical protein
MKTKKLIELEHKYKLEEIKLNEESRIRLIDAERKAKLEVERLHHENALGEIRFKKASIELTEGKRRL